MAERVYGTRTLIDRGDITAMRTDDAGDPPAPEKGQALFRIQRVAITANNVTYAAFGEQMGYWRFFPAPDGSGILPVWGYAECTASKAKGLSKGDRFYGYWPLAEYLLCETDRVDSTGFVDPSEHRQGLADVYNRYERRPKDGERMDEVIESLLRPLWVTGWLIGRSLTSASDFGAEQIVMSSASSKTGYSCAWELARREPDEAVETIGLTSPGNLAYTQSLGLYDRVVAYNDLESLSADRPTVYVDFAGSTDLRARVHTHFGSRLGRSIAVGATQWEEMDQSRTVPPPEAKMFFAPDVIKDQMQTHGRDAFARVNAAAWADFAEWVRPHIDLRTLGSLTEAADAYRGLATGTLGGAAGIIAEY
ncbi:MAG: DUF2855 family protein [Pacificimonas sp.]|jgi:hypothetical protein|nr:DUF2855 family protein [Pacificimonas sp.]